MSCVRNPKHNHKFSLCQSGMERGCLNRKLICIVLIEEWKLAPEDVEAYTLLGRQKTIQSLCSFPSLDTVYSFISSLGIHLQTLSKRTKRMSNGRAAYTFTTITPLGNSFFLRCVIKPNGSGRNSLSIQVSRVHFQALPSE